MGSEKRDIGHEIRDLMAAHITVEGIGSEHATVYMPFNDGDGCSIHATKVEGGWELSDGGVALNRAYETVIRKSGRRVERIRSLLAFYGIQEISGELSIATTRWQIPFTG